MRELLADWPRDARSSSPRSKPAPWRTLCTATTCSPQDGRVTTIVIETDAYSSLGEAGDASGDFAEGCGQRRAAAVHHGRGEQRDRRGAARDRRAPPGAGLQDPRGGRADDGRLPRARGGARHAALHRPGAARDRGAALRAVSPRRRRDPAFAGRDPLAGDDARADGRAGHADHAADPDPALLPARGRGRRLGARPRDLLPETARGRRQASRRSPGLSPTRASPSP